MRNGATVFFKAETSTNTSLARTMNLLKAQGALETIQALNKLPELERTKAIEKELTELEQFLNPKKSS